MRSSRKEASPERELGQCLLVFISPRAALPFFLIMAPRSPRALGPPQERTRKVSVLTQKDYFPFSHYPSSREVFCVLSIHGDQVSNLRNLREEKAKA